MRAPFLSSTLTLTLTIFGSVNAMGYCFASLMINEFERITLTCVSQNLVPSGPEYNNLTHQVCTLAGGTSGSDQIPGSRYITDTFSYLPSQLWRNWGLTILLIAFFLFLNVTLGVRTRKSPYGLPQDTDTDS